MTKIQTTHVGSLPRSNELSDLLFKKDKKEKIDQKNFDAVVRKDVKKIELMNLANFCRNCLSRWYREEAEKKGVSISDPDAREHIYGMPYSEWKEKYQK